MDEEYEEFYIKLSFSLSIIKYVERKWSLIEGRIRNICERNTNRLSETSSACI
jgi:hypothetical protein